MTGLAAGPKENFYPYGIALHVATQANSLDSVADEFTASVMQVLPSVAIDVQRDMGSERFKYRFETIGAPLIEGLFWGLEGKELKLIIIDFNAHLVKKGGRRRDAIRVVPSLRKCPGRDCSPSNEADVLPVGNHGFIDRFIHDDRNKVWLSRQDIDGLPRNLVQMEIENDPDCECGPPVNVLHMDTQNTYWVGEHGSGCKDPY